MYTINVLNDKSTQARGTVRIFMAPKFNEKGEEFKYSEMRLLMMEMDRFTVNREFQLLQIREKFIKNAIFLNLCSASGRECNQKEVH